MAKNLLLSPKTQIDIDSRVERVLRGLGNPEPPLDLAIVRELLRLDLAFYTADDPGLAQEAISRIRVGAIQVFNRPSLILDAIRTFSLKALYLPDRKRIMLDSSVPELKHRWNEAHEVGHSLLPWHDEMMHGDNEHTLSKACLEHIEAEANFAAGRLLFLRDRFAEEARSSVVGISAIRELKKTYGNTLSSTLWRFVECVGETVPVVGMISCHPHLSRRPSGFDDSRPARHFIQSSAFQRRFARQTEQAVFNAVAGYCGQQRGGMLGRSDEVVLIDDDGVSHQFRFETFFNSYDALTLGVHLRKRPLVMAVGAV